MPDTIRKYLRQTASMRLLEELDRRQAQGRVVGGKQSVVAGGKCVRCEGTGYMPEFAHVVGGMCYRCRGSGTDPGPGFQRQGRRWKV